jgi:hypothetical protein
VSGRRSLQPGRPTPADTGALDASSLYLAALACPSSAKGACDSGHGPLGAPPKHGVRPGTAHPYPTHRLPIPSPQPLLIAGLARMRHSSSSPVFDIGAPPSCPPSCVPTHLPTYPPTRLSLLRTLLLPSLQNRLCLRRALGCLPAAKLPAGPSSHRSRHPVPHTMLRLGVEHKQAAEWWSGLEWAIGSAANECATSICPGMLRFNDTACPHRFRASPWPRSNSACSPCNTRLS